MVLIYYVYFNIFTFLWSCLTEPCLNSSWHVSCFLLNLTCFVYFFPCVSSLLMSQWSWNSSGWTHRHSSTERLHLPLHLQQIRQKSSTQTKQQKIETRLELIVFHCVLSFHWENNKERQKAFWFSTLQLFQLHQDDSVLHLVSRRLMINFYICLRAAAAAAAESTLIVTETPIIPSATKNHETLMTPGGN